MDYFNEKSQNKILDQKYLKSGSICQLVSPEGSTGFAQSHDDESCFVIVRMSTLCGVLHASYSTCSETPYLSTWLETPQHHLNGGWPKFWTGQVKGFAGLAHVDGKTYGILGDPTNIRTVLKAHQTDLKVTPTQSIFKLTAGPVELTLNFFTPIDPTDLKRHSLPASYFLVNAKSLDGNEHSVQVYFDISAEWVIGKASLNVVWNLLKLTNGTAVVNYDVSLNQPKTYQEVDELAEWGTVKFFTDAAASYQAGKDTDVRSHFVQNGKLPNTIDHHYRAVGDNWPVFGFAHDFGHVGHTVSANFYYGLARVRSPAFNLATGPIKSLWEDYFHGDSNQMIEFVFADREDALKRAQALDHKIITDSASEGDSYVKIVSYSLRQAYGGTEMVGTKDKPWMMLKEISSDGNCQTIDVLYPHFPVHYYLNPMMIKYLLDPIFDNQEKGFWPHKYAIHDLGTHYPRCIGHTDGRDETMEVEETANMIIMTAAYLKATKDAAYVTKHYATLIQWAKYLVDKGLYPGDQLTTDDFLGRLKNSTNLSVKAIIGLAAMSQIAHAANHEADGKHYLETAHSYMQTWEKVGLDHSGKHIKMSYNVEGSWFLLYNMYFDKMLETNVVPKKIFNLQDTWYHTVMGKYGIPLISTHKTTKSDWEMLAAAASEDATLKKTIYDRIALWIKETDSNAPLSDYYDTTTGHSPMFINRPVVGSMFGALALKQHKH